MKNLYRVVFGACVIGMVVLGGCSRGCSCSRSQQTLGPDGKPRPLATLPGHHASGDLQIHAFDRYMPALHGPFTAGQEFKPPSGKARADVCRSAFVKEGVYSVTCVFDEPGTWEAKVTAEAGAQKGEMGYKALVK